MTALLWVLAALAAWAVTATGIAVVIGKAIATADARCCPHVEMDAPSLAEGGCFL